MTDVTGRKLYFGLVLLVDLECITDSAHVLFYEGENVTEQRVKAEEKAP